MGQRMKKGSGRRNPAPGSCTGGISSRDQAAVDSLAQEKEFLRGKPEAPFAVASLDWEGQKRSIEMLKADSEVSGLFTKGVPARFQKLAERASELLKDH